MSVLMHPIAPLLSKADALEQQRQQLQDIIDQCRDLMAKTRVKPCPSCGVNTHVYLRPWIHPNPEHDDNAILIQCDWCCIQTRPEYWFINEPHTAKTALFNVLDNWNTRPAYKETA